MVINYSTNPGRKRIGLQTAARLAANVQRERSRKSDFSEPEAVTMRKGALRMSDTKIGDARGVANEAVRIEAVERTAGKNQYENSKYR